MPDPDVTPPTICLDSTPEAEAMSNLRRHLGTIFLLGFLIFVVYSNTFHSEWHFDDRPNIVENPGIRTFDNLKYYLMGRVQRPVAYLSFALNWQMSGDDPFSYHVTNTVIHWIAASLIYGLVWTTLRLPKMIARYGAHAGRVASFSAILWAVHPIQTQSVTYIVQRMASMAGMFMFAALWMYVLGRRNPRWGPRIAWWFGGLLMWALSLGTKELAVVLPGLIVLYEFCFFRGADWTLLRRPRAVFTFLGAIPAFFVLGMLYVGPAFLKHLEHGYSLRAGEFTLWQRVLTQWRVVWTYLSLLVFPHPDRLNLDWDYPLSNGLFDPPTTFFGLVGILGLIVLGIWMARREPLGAFCIWWFFANLVLESTVLPLEMVFEHRLYVPSVGFCVGVTWAVVRLATRKAASPGMAPVTGGAAA